MTGARDVLEMWTIYDHPLDNPDLYVARAWTVGGDGVLFAGQQTIALADLDQLRQEMRLKGLVPIHRAPDDDPKIVETWV
jgi:hypothetical protein